MAKINYIFDTIEDAEELEIFQNSRKLKSALSKLQDEIKRGRDSSTSELQHQVYLELLSKLTNITINLGLKPQ